MNLCTVTSPPYAASALNLIGTYFARFPYGRAVLSHFGGVEPSLLGKVSRHYGRRVVLSEVAATCEHAHTPGIWFFKAAALVAAKSLGEPFLYLDARTAIMGDMVDLTKILSSKTRFYVQLPPSPELANGRWTTRRCLRKLGCDEDRYRHFAQYMGGIQAYLPTPENWSHIDEVHRLMHDPEVAGPPCSVHNPDGPGEMCVEHRGDQSVLSTLIERNGWHQPFDARIFLRYGDLATASGYGKGHIDLPDSPPTVVAFRHRGVESIPPALRGIAGKP